MTELFFAAAGLVAGYALAELRRRRQSNTALAAARTNLHREQRRNLELQRAAARLRQREHIAAAQIVALSYALHDATAQARGGHAAVIDADPWAILARFSSN
jgi:hypothetical protein